MDGGLMQRHGGIDEGPHPLGRGTATRVTGGRDTGPRTGPRTGSRTDPRSDPHTDTPSGPRAGLRPWLGLFAGIVGGAVGIGVMLALGCVLLLTISAAQAQPHVGGTATAAADRDAEARSRLQAHAGSGLLLMTSDGPVAAPLQSTDTRLTVTGPIVRAVVVQRYRNPGDAWLEGRYLFPLPEGAAVDQLRMTIGDRIVHGEIREREAARKAFTQARAAGQRAALVEQQRPNAFTTEVTQIAPHAIIDITIEYQQTLALADGSWRLRVPGVVAPRYHGRNGSRDPADIDLQDAGLIERQTAPLHPAESGPDARGTDDAWQPPTMRQGYLLVRADAVAGVASDAAIDGPAEASAVAPADPMEGPARAGHPGRDVAQPVLLPGQAPVNPVRITVDLDAGLPVGLPRSASHAVDVVSAPIGGGTRYRITTRDGEHADRDFELEWSPAGSAVPQATLRHERFGDLTYGLLTITPPVAGTGAVRQPRETTFVVDTSGSMGGESIEQARAALQFGLARLMPGDRFNLVQFNSTHSSLFATPQPVDAATLAQARRYVANLTADGGTEMAGAIRQALGAPLAAGLPGQVVFITDGAVADEDSLVTLIRKHVGARRLYTVGIGSAPNGWFLREAARLGGGTVTLIGRVNEVERRMAKLFDKLSQPMSTDLAVTLIGGELAETIELPRDLHAGEPLVVLARFRSLPRSIEVSARAPDGTDTSTGTGTGTGGDGRWRVPVAVAATDSAGVHVQWARARIARLTEGLRQARRGGSAATATVDENGRAVAPSRDAIVRLALEHHVVSDFTSLVAVDRTPVRPADAVTLRGEVPANLPAGWDATRVLGEASPTRQAQDTDPVVLARTATPAALQLALGVLLLAAGFALLLSRRACGVLAAGRRGLAALRQGGRS